MEEMQESFESYLDRFFKKKSVGKICVYIGIILVVLFFIFYRPKEEYTTLDTAQIEEILIIDPMWDEEKPLNEEDAGLVADYLERVHLSGEPSGNTEDWAGLYQAMFRVRLQDGSSYTFSADSPYYIIDGEQAYSTRARVCRQIRKLYQSLVKQYLS